MEILPDIEIVDLALYHKEENLLVITDTQIGYEESLNKKGVLVPRFQYDDLIERLENIIDVTKPKNIIINGDIKHEFGTISTTEWRHTLRLIDFLTERANVMLIKGNHDTTLGPIADKKEIRIRDHYMTEGIYFCHGHKIPKDKQFKKAHTVVIGHEHPAVALKDRGRVEKYKCFLKGKYKDKKLIVLPSFNLLTEGTDILSEKLLSPFLKQNIDDFEIYVVERKIMYFGKIKNLV